MAILQQYTAQLTQAVKDLPASYSYIPVNPPAQNDVKYDNNGAEIIAAHDPRRIAAEQKLIACLNLSVITTSGISNKYDSEKNQFSPDQSSIDFTKDILTRKCAAEKFDPKETPLERLNKKIDLLPLPEELKEKFRFALIENDVEKFGEVMKTLRRDDRVPPISYAKNYEIEGKTVQETLMDKFYQISNNEEKEGPLRSQSHDRQYDENRRIDNTAAVMNKYAQENEAKIEFWKNYFSKLNSSGVYKDQDTIVIKDDGVETGVVTAEIAKAALDTFKDKKIVVIGVDRQTEITERAKNYVINDEILQKASAEGKFEYYAVAHLVGLKPEPNEEIMKITDKVGKVDISIESHLYNFEGKTLIDENSHYMNKNGVSILIHASDDFQGVIRDATNGACRNPVNQFNRITKQIAVAGKETAEGTMKAAMRGLEPFSAEDVQKILALKNGDFSNKLFMKPGEEKKLDMLIIAEKIGGTPIVGYDHESRKALIETFNSEVTNKIPVLNSGCTLVQMSKEMSPELWAIHKESFQSSLLELNPRSNDIEKGDSFVKRTRS